MQSEEVRKELPEATQRFAKIDEVVRAVLGDFAATKNVVACCTKEGLLKHLEAQQGELELCEKVGGRAGEGRVGVVVCQAGSSGILDGLVAKNVCSNTNTILSACHRHLT